MLWKLIIRFLQCHKRDYIRAISSGKDIFIVEIQKYVPAEQELQQWISAFERAKAAIEGGHEMKKVQFRDKNKPLTEYTKIVVETDDNSPITIAEITSEDVKTADGYRVRLTPKYD